MSDVLNQRGYFPGGSLYRHHRSVRQCISHHCARIQQHPNTAQFQQLFIYRSGIFLTDTLADILHCGFHRLRVAGVNVLECVYLRIRQFKVVPLPAKLLCTSGVHRVYLPLDILQRGHGVRRCQRDHRRLRKLAAAGKRSRHIPQNIHRSGPVSLGDKVISNHLAKRNRRRICGFQHIAESVPCFCFTACEYFFCARHSRFIGERLVQFRVVYELLLHFGGQVAFGPQALGKTALFHTGRDFRGFLRPCTSISLNLCAYSGCRTVYAFSHRFCPLFQQAVTVGQRRIIVHLRQGGKFFISEHV